ncbi:hypothetical protein FOS14_13475 [Skermania sp. ID1734]|uniref:hypothetical protein n=1 Tax=Skermania sp. ID1734 TaxID=2597516 RepID=UPI00117BE0E9|nr:hypothetical protein [Skermania sp. ID1734]TSD99348.1 hypothetical protein FOS14_13475 [Skermania sp. ID1734]
MLSQFDDYPIHQVAQPIRQVATSDRNFYDRYYFNCYSPEADLFLIVGLGQYPNLGVADGFAVARRGDDHIVVRVSKALGADRADTAVGPLRVEVVEGLRVLRVVLEPGNGDVAFDLTFTGNMPAHEEARHHRRHLERVVIDTTRFVQTGTWTGTVEIDGESRAVAGWRGNRDRSWGIRPVGEAEPPGRRAAAGLQNFFWIYAVMQFDDFSVFTIMQEDERGRRIVEEAVRIWPDADREPEWLGRSEHRLEFAPGTRDVTAATLCFRKPSGDVEVRCSLRLANYIGIDTGYGLEPDWRHGMWQGDLVVQSRRKRVSSIDPGLRLFCPVDHLADFEWREDGRISYGTGLFEVGVIGPHDRYGFTSFTDTAKGVSEK